MAGSPSPTTSGTKIGTEVWNRLTVHYTPKHGSWLNQAEIEISLFARQCLGTRRIPDLKTATAGNKGVEPTDESRAREDQLEIRPPKRPAQVRLSKELF